MLSESEKLIFIHISKSGGTSIGRYFFGKKYEHQGLFIRDLEKRYDLDQYFKFVFVRNPWDRMVSGYYQSKKPYNLARPSRKAAYEAARHLSFNGWLEFMYINYSQILLNSNYLNRICDSNGKVRMDFIGRFENIQSDFARMCKENGFPGKKLEHLNATGHRHYAEYYDQKSIKIIEKLYGNDIEYFKYTFNN